MQKVVTFFTFLLAGLVFFITGCRKQATETVVDKKPEPDPMSIVAVVNKVPLTWGDMEKRSNGFLEDDIKTNHLIVPPDRMDEAKDHFRRKSVNAFIFKTLMMEEAEKQGLKLEQSDRDKGLKALAEQLKVRNWSTNDFFLKGPMDEPTMRQEFEDGLLIDKMLMANVRSGIKVSNDEMTNAIVRLQQANLQKKEKLEEVRKKLQEGADFAAVARTISECETAKDGGSLGEFTRGKILKPIEDAAFALQPGEISPVIQSRFGFHIVKVIERTPAKPAVGDSPEVAETIKAAHILLKHIEINRKKVMASLIKAKYNKEVERYYKELRSKADIKCFLFEDMTSQTPQTPVPAMIVEPDLESS